MLPLVRRNLLHAALFGVVLLIPGAGCAGAAAISVTGPAELAAALAAATGGETIRLAPGDYGQLALDGSNGKAFGFARPVTLVSADPADPAVFTGANVLGVRNMVFDGLRFDYSFAPGDPLYKRPFQFTDCRDLTIRNSVFDGDVARGVSPEADGVGTGFGLAVGKGTGVTIANNRITGFYRGLVMGGGQDVTVRGNELSGLRMDGMNFVGMQDVRIEGNYIHGFRRSGLRADHADMIQFWTKGSHRPSTGITISGNLLSAGDGNSTQSIFMRNEEVDSGRAGPEMFYRDVLIENNVILNGHLHGIMLGEARGVVIRSNTVLRDPAFDTGPDRDKPVRIPRIRVVGASLDVRIEDNITAGLSEPKPGWQITGNLLAQDLGVMKPGFYDLLFTPHPVSSGPASKSASKSGPASGPAGADLAQYLALRYLPGSPADRPGLGSDLMR